MALSTLEGSGVQCNWWLERYAGDNRPNTQRSGYLQTALMILHAQLTSRTEPKDYCIADGHRIDVHTGKLYLNDSKGAFTLLQNTAGSVNTALL